jgi:predicted nuclease of predicted toxin-antitoxin system
MKVLLDECLPRRLLRDFSGFSATTVPRQGWAGKSDSELLSLAADEFDVFITLDSNLVFQQNLKMMSLSIVVLHAVNSRYETFVPLIPKLLEAVESIETSGAVITVG